MTLHWMKILRCFNSETQEEFATIPMSHRMYAGWELLWTAAGAVAQRTGQTQQVCLDRLVEAVFTQRLAELEEAIARLGIDEARRRFHAGSLWK